jgi:hypothetical protein
VAANPQTVADIIAAGAFAYLDTLTRLNLTDDQTDAAIVRRYGVIRPVTLEDAFLVVVNYQLWRQGGDLINRRTDNRTVYGRYLPTIEGCEAGYEYVVVVPFNDPINDIDRTRAFTVRSDVLLGKDDILTEAYAMAAEWAAAGDTGPAAAGEDIQWQISGPGRITAAALCV